MGFGMVRCEAIGFPDNRIQTVIASEPYSTWTVLKGMIIADAIGH